MTQSVLIVDDDPPLRELLRTLLLRAVKPEVVSCADGAEAIAALSQRSFDVILLDLLMPLTDGMAVIDYLREHAPEQLRVVLVMTAAEDAITSRLDPTVVHGMILKPFDNETVVQIVLEIFAAAREHTS